MKHTELINIFVIVVLGICSFLYISKDINKVEINDNPDGNKLLKLERYKDEQRYCQNYNLNFSDNYYLNKCLFIECENNTGRATYQICNQNKDDDSFAGGLLVGWLLFSK